MAFSDTEIQASVEQIILSSIRRPYDTLGVRRTDITFTDVQEAAAGVFLLNRNAPFYVLFLATRRLIEAVNDEMEVLNSLIDAVSAVGNNVLPIEDLTSLSNAQAALLEIESAIGQRDEAFKEITSVPAYVRFENNVNQFLDSAGKNVKAGGQIVQTPQEARNNIPGLVTSLETSHGELITSVELVRDAMENFAAVNLPALAAQGVISRARQVLDDRVEELGLMSPVERLEIVRQVVLDLLTQKGLVKGFGSFAGPAAVFDVEGTGTPFSDSTHLATPARLETELTGPYGMNERTNILDFFLDATFTAKATNLSVDSITQAPNVFEANFNKAAGFGALVMVPGDVIYVQTGVNALSRWVVKTVGPTVVTAVGDHDPNTPDPNPTVNVWPAPTQTVAMAPALTAKLEGFLAEPFDIHVAGGGFPATNVFIFKIDNTTVTVVLVADPTKTAQDVADEINTAIGIQAPGKPVEAEAYLSPLKYENQVNISHVVATTYRFTVLAGNLDGLNIQVGDVVRITSGPDFATLLTISAVQAGPGSTFVDASSGGVIASSGTRQTIQIGPALRKVRIACIDPPSCLGALTRLEVSTATTNTAAGTLGFGKGLFSQTRKVPVRELVADFNQRAGTRVTASSTTTLDFTGKLKTVPLLPQKLVAYKFSGVADVSVAGLNVTITSSGLLASGVVVGDVVAFRSGADLGEKVTVVTVTDTTITGVQAGLTTGTGVSIEIGPNISSPVGKTVHIDAGANAGDYEVSFADSIPFDLTVTQNLPLNAIGTAAVEMTGTVGRESAAFSSTNTTTASKVLALGSALNVFFVGVAGGPAVGTSPWFKLPEVPSKLQVGDKVQVYNPTYNVPRTVYVIDSIDKSLKVVGIEPEIASNESWTFSQKIPVPFALLVAGTVSDSTSMEDRLDTWINLPVNQASYFIDLNRFINPLLVNTNPTAVQVSDALNKLKELAKVMTAQAAELYGGVGSNTLDSILFDYSVPIEPSVDVLIKGFLEKGADRAVDILLSGDFSSFFGLTADQSSYAGNMLEAIRDIARSDLPVDKFNRPEANKGKLLVNTTSEDFETESSDISKDKPVAPPV